MGGQRRGGFVAERQFDDQRILREDFVETLAMIEFGNFENQHREGRGLFQVIRERFERVFARIVAAGAIVVVRVACVAIFRTALDGFGAVNQHELAGREHGHSFGTLKYFAPVAAAHGNARERPVAHRLRHVGFDDFVAAHVAQVGIAAFQHDGADGLAFRQFLDQFFRREIGH